MAIESNESWSATVWLSMSRGSVDSKSHPDNRRCRIKRSLSRSTRRIFELTPFLDDLSDPPRRLRL